MARQGVEAVIADLRLGRIVLVSDNEDRENEGDLICAAAPVTDEQINFMAAHARGLICMPMANSVCRRLGLEPMSSRNGDNHQTAFMVSVDHVSATTGISCGERALTARACADPGLRPGQLRRPGHMFPLEARPMGVLEREGHTEATVDLLTLAGQEPCGLCCEIMAEDGTMMRRPQLREFARRWDLASCTMADIKAYRWRHEVLVERAATASLPTRHGDFMVHAYRDRVSGAEHLALVTGDIGDGSHLMCRMHSECLTGDVLGSLRCDCGQQLDAALEMIAHEGRGVLLYLRQEGRGIGLIDKLRAYALQERGMDTLAANEALGYPGDARDYAVGAQMLRDLGVTSLRLLTNNPDKVDQLAGCGIDIAERVPLQMPATAFDLGYLRTKKTRMGHLLDY
ncbi:GTP cyclohydrolase II [Propionibacterium sp.]|uniref:GTP cyclohydrolase II n=1 Tax=Propionibacterium sp. TaxID=1977903 RepID=UPI0039E9E97D